MKITYIMILRIIPKNEYTTGFDVALQDMKVK